MFVWIAAIAALSFYIGAMPVKFALVLHISAHPGFGAGISVFEGRFALRNAKMRAQGLKKHLPWKKTEVDLKKKAALSAALQVARHLFAQMKLESLTAQGRISAPDAAQTAILCGCAQGIQASLAPLLPPGRLNIHIEPDFSALRSDLGVQCMLSIPAGHIMLAALIGAWNYFARSIHYGKASH